MSCRKLSVSSHFVLRIAVFPPLPYGNMCTLNSIVVSSCYCSSLQSTNVVRSPFACNPISRSTRLSCLTVAIYCSQALARHCTVFVGFLLTQLQQPRKVKRTKHLDPGRLPGARAHVLYWLFLKGMAQGYCNPRKEGPTLVKARA